MRWRDRVCDLLGQLLHAFEDHICGEEGKECEKVGVIPVMREWNEEHEMLTKAILVVRLYPTYFPT